MSLVTEDAIFETSIFDDDLLDSIIAATPQQNNQPNLDSMLGSLQDHMSKQGVATVTKGTCAGCNKPIIGQVFFNSFLLNFLFIL